MKGGQLHTIFISSVDVQSEIEYSEMGEDKTFIWHQFHVKGLGSREFEVHAPVATHNASGRAVPLTWILLDSQSTVDLIANPKVMANIRRCGLKTPYG